MSLVNRLSRFVLGSIAIVYCIFTVSCRKQESLVRETEFSKKIDFKKNNVSVHYIGNVAEKELSFNIRLGDNYIDELINEDFLVDISTPKHGQTVAEMITKRAKKIVAHLTIEQIVLFEETLEQMVISEKKSMPFSELKDPKNQGLFMSLSLIKATKRLYRTLNSDKIKSNSIKANNYQGEYLESANNVYFGYTRGLSSYVLNEDIIIDVQDLKYKTSGLIGIEEEFISFTLENDQDTYITLADLNTAMSLKYGLFSSRNSYNGLGSSWGCCGNYSGPCYAANPACYVHDYLCQSCWSRFFCGGDCRVDR